MKVRQKDWELLYNKDLFFKLRQQTDYFYSLKAQNESSIYSDA